MCNKQGVASAAPVKALYLIIAWAIVGPLIYPALLRAQAGTTRASPPGGPNLPAGDVQRETDQGFARHLVAAVTPSLVGVQYTYAGDVDQGTYVFAGVVVDDRGLVMIPLQDVGPTVADAQLQKWMVLTPSPDGGVPSAVDAIFQGRDRRSQTAFVRAATGRSTRVWTPVHFVDRRVSPGDKVFSVGLTPRACGHRPYLSECTVAARLNDTYRTILVTGGGLPAINSPVFNDVGEAIGVAGYTAPAYYLLNDDGGPDRPSPAEQMGLIRSFLPTSAFAPGLVDPPKPGQPVAEGYPGFGQLSGLTPEENTYLQVGPGPAVRVDEMAEGPAAPAGFRPGDVVVAIDGRPLETGDTPKAVKERFILQLERMRPGTRVLLNVCRSVAGQMTRVQISLVLASAPKQIYQARRAWSDRLGLGVREIMPDDQFELRLPPSDPGLVVTKLKPNASAQAAGILENDLVVQLNGRAMTNLDEFQAATKAIEVSRSVVVVIKRQGREQTLRVDLPQQ